MPAPARASGPGLNVGDCPPPGPVTCGDPISLPTGNVYEKVTDYTSAGQNRLDITRHYNSAPGAPGGSFGNWRWTYDRTLSISGFEIDANRPDGKSIRFFSDGHGGWNGVTDLDLRLTQSGSTWTLTDWEDNVETYTAVGQLTSITARSGYTQTITYPAVEQANRFMHIWGYTQTSQPTSVSDSYGRTLSITYAGPGSGLVTQITAPDGSVYSYAYYASGNLASVTYPDGSQRQYLHENANFPNALTGIIDENGNRFATWAYDSTFRAISSQHAGGANLTTVEYNNDGSVTVTNPLGVPEVYKFTLFQASINANFPQTLSICTEIDRLATATTPAAVRKFTYDSNGYVASITDWDGNVTTYTNDARGNELSRTLASGTPQALTVTIAWLSNFHLPSQTSEGNRTFSFAYDGNGNLLTKTIATSGAAAPAVKGGAITKTLTPQGTWLYTNKSPGQGRPAASSGTGTTSIWTYTYNSAGQVLTATDPDGNVTTRTYDAMGDVTSVTNALGQVTHYTSYDPDGRPLTIQDPNGLVKTLTYNFRGQITSKTEAQWVTTYAHDTVGQLTKLTRPDGSFLAFTYDAAHRLVGFADALGNRTVYTLDAAGDRTQWQVLGASSNLIRTRSYNYDAVTRLIQEIGAAGQTTSYAYDTNSNLTQIADPLGHATSAAYDALNRAIKRTDANGGLTTIGYDNESRLASVTDPRGLPTSYVHDGLDDLTSISSPDTGVTAKTYDAAGNLITSTDARGDTTTYTYDALNRITKATFADSTSIVYQYDQGANGIGHLTSMTDAGGTTTWVYDIHGHVTSKQQTTGAVTLTTSLTYTATTGLLASMTYPSGAAIFYFYDATGRVSAITYQPSGGTTSSLLNQIAYQPFGGPAVSWSLGNGGTYSRTFDHDGRIAGLALPASVTIALAYDAASRITGITETGLANKTFGYDALGRLTNYTGGALTQTYAYDANGNRTSFTATSPPSTALTYTYAAASNRLTGISGSETDSFTYDANGNMLSHNSPAADYTYTYNARNRRAQTLLGANATTDVINGLGQRTVQTVVSSQFFFYDEAGHLTGSYNGDGSVLAETVWLDDLPVAVLEPYAGALYIAPDHLGAPHEITNASVNVVWYWDHDPFGNGQPTGSFSYALRFPGQFYDQNAKLHYNYFRDYDPNTGRYIESDPIGLRSGINTYAYVGGNPIKWVDAKGQESSSTDNGIPNNVVPNASVPGPNGPIPITVPIPNVDHAIQGAANTLSEDARKAINSKLCIISKALDPSGIAIQHIEDQINDYLNNAFPNTNPYPVLDYPTAAITTPLPTDYGFDPNWK
jgi:RHS repeat-associated protein